MMEVTYLKPWPGKLTREEARAVKQREQEFLQVLKKQGRPSGWRFARGEIFREEAGWFISNMPGLAWQSGVWNRLQIKPMALDPLFWDIVGLPENNQLPISFRARGGWVLTPEWSVVAICPDEESVTELAKQVVSWSTVRLEALSTWSLDSMLADLGPPENLRYQQRSLAVCLHLLKGDLDLAQNLCLEAGDQNCVSADGGGFTINHADGTHSTFNQQALRWIASRRGPRRLKASASHP